GLVLAYVVNLWLIHWLAPALYLLPGYHPYDPRVVEAGLEVSVYAILAFGIGNLALAPLLRNSHILPRSTGVHQPDPYLPQAYLWTGVISYLLLSSSLGRLPSATALVSTGQQL